MLEEMDAAVAQAEMKGVRAVIITGAGKVFSAGADLDDARAGLATDPVWERLSARIVSLPCLTIAALNGTLAGGAMGMALACDMRICVPGAKFFYPVMKLGFLPQPSDPRRLAAIVGPARAKMLLMGGVRIEADEALAWGLVDRVCPPDALVAEARALATDAVGASADHVAAIKRLVP
jgi:enoyl-CoA hydratase/carnithine racemase